MKTWCASERRFERVGACLWRTFVGRMSSMTSRKEDFRKAARRFGLPRLLALTIKWEWRFFCCSYHFLAFAGCSYDEMKVVIFQDSFSFIPKKGRK
ncbi:unnamed protein product [Bathycoccus prasinos]